MHRNRDSGINIDVCMKTLVGIYDPNRGNCSYEPIYLNSQSIASIPQQTLSSFFDESQEFSLIDGKVVFLDGAEKHYLGSIAQLESYTVNAAWTWNEPYYTDRVYSDTVHFQVNNKDELVRFVSCTGEKDAETGLPTCTHLVETDRGTLSYRLDEEPSFDLERWQKTENDILSLIATWEAN